MGATVSLSLIQMYEPRIYFIALGLFGLLGIFEMFENGSIQLKNYVVFMPLIFSVVIGSFWILPVLFGSAVNSNELFNRGLFGDEYMSLLNSLTAYHPFWSREGVQAFLLKPVPMDAYILPFVVLLFFFFVRKKNKLDMYFSILLIGGFLLVKQSAVPFTGLYLWLYENVPLFNAYRESSKFLALISISSAYAVVRLTDISFQMKKGASRWIVQLSIFLLLVVSISQYLPFLSGKMGTLFEPRVMPYEYQIVNHYVRNADPNDERRYLILWIPRDSRWGDIGSTSPRLSLERILQDEWLPFIDYETDFSDLFVLKFLSDPDFERLIDVWGIRYIVVPSHDNDNDSDFFQYYGKREDFIHLLDDADFLQKQDIGVEILEVYENSGYLPHFYTTESENILGNDSVYTPVIAKRFNSTEYSVSLSDENLKDGKLYFQEAYNSGWILIPNIKKLTLFEKVALLNPKNKVSSVQSMSVAGMNVFELDQNTSTQYVLYFLPQSLLLVGAGISLSFVILLLSIIIFWRLKKKSESYVTT
jgi:hypothetical protein